jgi:hypothetical protein
VIAFVRFGYATWGALTGELAFSKAGVSGRAKLVEEARDRALAPFRFARLCGSPESAGVEARPGRAALSGSAPAIRLNAGRLTPSSRTGRARMGP